METKIDQKAYLQKYLSGPSKDKKKKKKKVVKGKGFKIIDDDIDLTKLRPLDGDELDVFDEGEDAPQIAGIIDDRPEEIKKLEQFKTTSKWKVVTQDDGFNSKLQIEEIKKDVKEAEKENELIFGKMYSDSEDERKNDSDPSPPRKNNTDQSKTKPMKAQNKSDSDISPPRKNKRTNDHDSSPPRKRKDTSNQHLNNSDSDVSLPRRGREPSPRRNITKNKNYESDLSPPRKHQKKERKPRKQSRWGDANKEETTRPRSPESSHRETKKQKVSHSPRRSKKNTRSSSSDNSPPRKIISKGDDSDLSPPRKSRNSQSSPKKRNKSPDSDLSPPRKKNKSPGRHKPDKYNSNNRSQDRYNKYRDNTEIHTDSDQSPLKRKRQTSKSPPRKHRKNLENRSRTNDYSESINTRYHSSESQNRRNDSSVRDDRYKRDKHRNSDSPPPSNKKMAKTLEGKKAGLQDAVQLRQENEAFRKREDEAFKKMTDDISGRNAQVVSRKGKRETSEERQKQKEKAERQKELDEKYKKWSKGIKQIEAQEARVQEFLHEASKPLARHKGDRDLEERLKQIERDGDPMLQYIREKKRDRGELAPEKPMYKGSFPPNRFNIRPGYRWDGVDRSNGYEKKYFEQQSKKKAQEEEAYKWSTEDL